mmetsp:Transcript_34172/g.73969  ORF Transcript_34172/g.73969 Transcript_34172/m.73969 type:complete len:257 (-) Transcript_34172:966-1736(-)
MGMPNGTIEYMTESPCIEALVSGIPMKHGLPWAERGRALEKYQNTPPNEPRPRTEGHTLEKAIQSHSGHVTSLANERGVRLLSVSLSRLAGAPLSESAFPHAHARGTKTAFPPPTRARFPPRTPRARPPVEGCRGITTDVPRGFVFVAICGEDRIVEGPFLPGGEPRTWVRRGLSLRAPGRKTNEILRGISSDISSDIVPISNDAGVVFDISLPRRGRSSRSGAAKAKKSSFRISYDGASAMPMASPARSKILISE